jgi:hypothetical protein
MARIIRSAVLPLLLVLMLLVVAHYVEAAAAKKGAKSAKKTSAANAEKKAAAAKKDWNKMTEEEWNAAEQEALDPEDRCDPARGPAAAARSRTNYAMQMETTRASQAARSPF